MQEKALFDQIMNKLKKFAEEHPHSVARTTGGALASAVYAL